VCGCCCNFCCGVCAPKAGEGDPNFVCRVSKASHRRCP
jgi:hypothetical protein